MCRALRNIIGNEASSYEDFVAKVQADEPREVFVILESVDFIRMIEGEADSGLMNYVVTCVANLSKGRKLSFSERCYVGGQHPPWDKLSSEEAVDIDCKMFLLGSERVKDLTKRLPGQNVIFFGPHGELVTPEVRAKYQWRVKRRGVAV